MKKQSEMKEVQTFESNQVALIGQIVSELQFSHEVYGEGFYTLEVAVKRLSGKTDIIPIMISERLIEVSGDYRGQYVYITGQFRFFNCKDEKKNRLMLYAFVRELEFLEGANEECFENQIFLDGYICKEILYRKTPRERKIADVLLAVNRPYGKSDYIPCVIWGRNAQYIANFPVGTRVQIWGRIQSRVYRKRFNENEVEKRVAYEVSVSKISLPEKGVM